MATKIQKLKWALHKKRYKMLLLYGLQHGLIFAYDDEKEALYKKLLDMDGIKIENVLLPKELIVKDGKLQGYTMDYFPDSIPLSDRFSVRYVDSKKLFDYVLKASKILRTLHDNDIIYQD